MLLRTCGVTSRLWNQPALRVPADGGQKGKEGLPRYRERHGDLGRIWGYLQVGSQ